MIEPDHLTLEHLRACATSLGLPPDAFTPRALAHLAQRIDDSAGPDGCWPWRGPRQGSGYGVAGHPDFGTTCGAHRIVHVLFDGPLADRRLVVRHRCDNRWCVNPAHLRRGTALDNSADARERGRLRGRVLDADEREQLVRLADRFARGRARSGRKMTRPELFAFMADVFDVSASRAGTILDEARRAPRVGQGPEAAE